MSKHTIDEIFKSVETKHSPGLFDKKLISSINLYEKNGELILDEHGHLIIDHNLDFIAEKFVGFARKQGFDFWRESYRYETTALLAAEGETKYGKNKTHQKA